MTFELKKDYLTNLNIKQEDLDAANNASHKENLTNDNLIAVRTTPETPPSSRQQSEYEQPSPSPPSHRRRHLYNERPPTPKKKEKQKKQRFVPKAPSGQGQLVDVPETKQPTLGKHSYPYWYYYKLKNPSWIMKHRQTEDGHLIPFDDTKPEKYGDAAEIANRYASSSVSSFTQKPTTKPKDNNLSRSIIKYNEDKKQYEYITDPKTKKPKRQTTPSSLDTSFKDGEIDRTQQKRQHLKSEEDWYNHYAKADQNQLDTLDHHQSSIQHLPHHHQSSQHIPVLISHTDNTNHRSTSRHHHHHHHQTHYFNVEPLIMGKELTVKDVSYQKTERNPLFAQDRTHNKHPVRESLPYIQPMRRIPERSSPVSLSTIEGDPSEVSLHSFNINEMDELLVNHFYKPNRKTKVYDKYLDKVLERKLQVT
ncbi:unnamed protein product [Didymodactylos carnosus]|uniref:Uncharacterized protein n=1 Tax=Didymodactylos carnosus TaxID=1234261 RepID=A0A813XJT0_9BILA|nr:unnamed protein product [Didymodactylos carnosus]CAF3655377.1 unnamed protein product [Didymodactylos carnosus]